MAPSRLLWTDVHQRIKLLTQKAAVLADLVKNQGLAGLGALVSSVVLSVLVNPQLTSSGCSTATPQELIILSVLMWLCCVFPAVSVGEEILQGFYLNYS